MRASSKTLALPEITTTTAKAQDVTPESCNATVDARFRLHRCRGQRESSVLARLVFEMRDERSTFAINKLSLGVSFTRCSNLLRL